MSTGTLSGQVTNAVTNVGIESLAIKTAPAIAGVSIVTDGNGSYSADLPVGSYTISFSASNYEATEQTASLVAGQTAAVNVALQPTANVVVSAGPDTGGSPGDAVVLAATATPMDGSTVQGYQWTQVAGAPATLTNADGADLTATLADSATYRDELFSHLKSPDRFMVQGISPFSLEEAELATFRVTITTDTGAYTDTVNVAAHLPYAVSSGLQNVPIDLPVLVRGKTQDAYTWQLTAPAGSSATLNSASEQHPLFTPDIEGQYVLAEATSGTEITMYAGTWIGAISGQGGDGLPVAASCTTCHNGTIAPDQFTTWRTTGHAEILTQNLNSSTHYGEGCFACHSVGFDKGADNGGFDDASDYQDFLAGGLINHPTPTNWTTMLAEYPQTAQLAQVQCESCHGPGSTALHINGELDSERISVSADVCATCHGEPKRHARFQQWEESGHSNFELAISRGAGSASCARCHSAQGFLAWLPQLEAGNPGNLEAEITWTADTVQPQTCVVCHDPHDTGNTSGDPNNAKVRISGDTPMLPAGYQATSMGRGAMCITCHNTRNGAHNDTVPGMVDDRAPHTSGQGDVLMGQNSYFVAVGARAPHSYIENTCATCHMELTPPPDELSYNLGGTNHTFAASRDICAACHGDFKGLNLENAIHGLEHQLEVALADAVLTEIGAQIAAGNTVTLRGVGADGADVELASIEGATATITESRGRQAVNITIGGTEYSNVRITGSTLVKDAAGAEIGPLSSSEAGQVIVKAGWNYWLLHADGSGGIHNPSFVLDVLNTSIERLRVLAE